MTGRNPVIMPARRRKAGPHKARAYKESIREMPTYSTCEYVQAFDSIDPGVDYFARARWEDNTLVAAGIYPATQPPEARVLVIMEKQQVYKHSTARSSDIVDLAIAAGGYAKAYGKAIWYLPREWKGQIPKKAHHPKILAALTERERELLSVFNKTQLKDILDAVGIGLYHLEVTGQREYA